MLTTIKSLFSGKPALPGTKPASPNRRLPDPEARAVFGPRSPFVTEYLMVQSRGFKGMAYRDPEHQWREAYSGLKLPGPVRVLG